MSSDWRYRGNRFVLNVCLAGWFYVVGFWLGPNRLTFGKFEGFTKADIAEVAKQNCVRTVREIKIFKRDHGFAVLQGNEPGLFDLLQRRNGDYGRNEINRDGNYEFWAPNPPDYKHTITYDFTPGHEGWSVSGPYVNGPIDLPPVTIESDAK
jgi:hypothetical protein